MNLNSITLEFDFKFNFVYTVFISAYEVNFMSNFDKTLLGKNIKFLATQKGIKVGDIETEAGVSTGYLSRLANEDNKNNFPIMDLIFLISKKFDVSINTLLSVDFSNLTPNEILLSQFFDKLNKDTENNKIIWELDSKEKLESMKLKGSHPLFFQHQQDPFFSYHSFFDQDVEISGDSYKVCIENKWLFFMAVSNVESPNIDFELYFIYKYTFNSQNEIEKICKICHDSELYKQIIDLRNVAAESSRHVKLSDSVLNTINTYLSHEDENVDDIEF